MTKSESGRTGVWGLVAAIFAAAASTLCCIGPLIYLLFGVSAAWLVDIPGASVLQIPMMLLSLGLMLSLFWRLYLSPKPICINLVSRKTLVILYWITWPIVLFLLFYPYILAWIFEWMEL